MSEYQKKAVTYFFKMIGLMVLTFVLMNIAPFFIKAILSLITFYMGWKFSYYCGKVSESKSEARILREVEERFVALNSGRKQ